MNNSTIHQLKPSAARLLLAFLSAKPTDNYDAAIVQSGITDCRTLAAACTQLRDLGFLTEGPDGREYAHLPGDEEPAQQNSFPSIVNRQTRTTQAKGF